MLAIVWLLEQCVVVAPVLGVALYLAWPERRRKPWLKAVTGVLTALFVVNLIGVYPGPARVSCTGLPPVCTERRPGSAETPRVDARTGGVGSGEVETPPSAHGGGSLRSVGAALPRIPAASTDHEQAPVPPSRCRGRGGPSPRWTDSSTTPAGVRFTPSYRRARRGAIEGW